ANGGCQAGGERARPLQGRSERLDPGHLRRPVAAAGSAGKVDRRELSPARAQATGGHAAGSRSTDGGLSTGQEEAEEESSAPLTGSTSECLPQTSNLLRHRPRRFRRLLSEAAFDLQPDDDGALASEGLGGGPAPLLQSVEGVDAADAGGTGQAGK